LWVLRLSAVLSCWGLRLRLLEAVLPQLLRQRPHFEAFPPLPSISASKGAESGEHREREARD
jgi:hypothetical protein